MDSDRAENIIVVGASAGGMNAVSRFLASLKEDVNASIFIVIHLSGNSMAEIIVNHLQKFSEFPCKIPKDNETIANKTVYLAPQDRHLLITKGIIKVQRGAHENHYRPSIDVLFRTAAAAYDSCVIGVILTGLLDDGTSGMSAIQRSGGICIVQEPKDAEFSGMPLNVLKNVQVNYQVPVNEMGYIISDILSGRKCRPSEVPEEIKKEADITIRMSSEIQSTDSLGDQVSISCPDCGGSLFKIKEPPADRYRCFTGHTFTNKFLEKTLQKDFEESLWVAVRIMEERKNLLYGMLENEAPELARPLTKMKTERAQQLQIHIERLKSMLQEL